MTNRRSFLRVLGMAPVAAPLAIKAAAEQAVGQLSGVASGGLAAGHFTGAGQAASNSLGGMGGWHKKILQLVAENALPDWYDEHLRRMHGQVTALDPDIASKRSWSMNVKIATQRERNIARARNELTDGPERQLRRDEFCQKTGVYL